MAAPGWRRHRHRYVVEVPLSRRGRRQGAALRHRRRPPGLRMGRGEERQHEARMAGLAPAFRDAAAPPRSAALHAGGPSNPLGARALYLGSTLYRIHGTNEPYTIGQAVSSGCIRMTNDDVIDLYNRVTVGSKVVVI